jgi:hypothetical protein
VAVRNWEIVKVRYCDHVGEDVSLEAETVYPADFMPDQPARVLAHRCSMGIHCMLMNKPSCMWAGSNPAFDPFQDKEEN